MRVRHFTGRGLLLQGVDNVVKRVEGLPQLEARTLEVPGVDHLLEELIGEYRVRSQRRVAFHYWTRGDGLGTMA